MITRKSPRKIISNIYPKIVRPILFRFEAEKAHNFIIFVGETMGKTPMKRVLKRALTENHSNLNQELLGLKFTSPVGLAAGLDYNGRVAEILPSVGLGFNTVGTVTAKPYEGNPTPRLTRLTDSQSILVNKGFKSDGAKVVAARLDKKQLEHGLTGISVGSSNIPSNDRADRAIDDYLKTFSLFKNKPYVKYFELNISCPNTRIVENFAQPASFESLLKEVARLKITQPIFIKMPSEIAPSQVSELVKIAFKYGHKGFIFSNLVKIKRGANLSPRERGLIEHLPGGISGRPTFQASNKLIGYAHQAFGPEIVIIGCGGIFSAEDAYLKIKLGANLVQVLTGLIYKGPLLVSEINHGLASLLEKDGFSTIDEAVGYTWRSKLHP